MATRTIRVFDADGTAQDFLPSGPTLPPSPQPQFREGDLVRCIAVLSRVPHGAIGVVRCFAPRGLGVEWAGFKYGQDLTPWGQTRHHPKSGWIVTLRDIEYAIQHEEEGSP